jgi:hypothetical protein
MTLSFSDLAIDQDRMTARHELFKHLAALDFNGQDMYSAGQTLLFAASNMISPLQGGLSAEMNAVSEAFVHVLKDKQYHIRQMIEFLHKRWHLTLYMKENDGMLMRLIAQFESITSEDIAAFNDANDMEYPIERNILAARHADIATDLVANQNLKSTSVAKAMQDVAVTALALANVSHRHFLVSLKVQSRHLRKLEKSVRTCRYGIEDMIHDQEKMNAHMGSKDSK